MPNDLQNFNTLDSGEINKNTLTEEQLRIIAEQQKQTQGGAEFEEKYTTSSVARTKDDLAKAVLGSNYGRNKDWVKNVSDEKLMKLASKDPNAAKALKKYEENLAGITRAKEGKSTEGDMRETMKSKKSRLATSLGVKLGQIENARIGSRIPGTDIVLTEEMINKVY